VKQIYKITYPTGKIYTGKDAIGSCRYFGSPEMDLVNADFQNLPEVVRKDYTVRKQILWETEYVTDEELSAKEVEFIREHQSHNPEIGYNRWQSSGEYATADIGFNSWTPHALRIHSNKKYSTL
jgi:hypothetical protein